MEHGIAVEGGTLRWNRSFAARIIQSEDQVKQWYSQMKNELLSFANVKVRASWKRETFRIAGAHLSDGSAHTVARLSHRGKTLCLFLPLDPDEYAGTKYKIERVENTAAYQDTPCLYRIKNEKRMRYALELIDTVMDKLSVTRTKNKYVNYVPPYESTEKLAERGLIRRVMKTDADEAIFKAQK